MAPYIGYDSEAFFPRTLNSDLTITGGGVTQIGGDINFDSGTLFIDEDLNRVGIGTTNPEVKLDVHGNSAAIRVFESPDGADVRVVAGGSTGYIGTYSQDNLQILSGGATAIIANISQNVGIGGAIAPDVRLHINGANAYPATSGTTPTGFIALRNTAGATHGAYIGVANVAPWGTWIQAQDKNNLGTSYPILLNPNGGNVGIGTTNPQGKLEVTGGWTYLESVWLKGTNTLYLNDGDWSLGYSGTGLLIQTTGSDDVIINSNNFIFSGYGQGEKVRITNSGNVGIGTTNPLVALDVAGVIREELHSSSMPVGLNDDIGVNWTKVEMGAGLEIIYSLVYCGNGIVLAGGGFGADDGDVYRSTDFGQTWTQIEMGAGLDSIYSLVYCGNGIILAGAGNGTTSGDGDIYRSTDYGLTWTQIEMGAGLEYILSLVYCGNGIVLAGSGLNTGDGDVYRSTDFGQTWTQIEMGAGLEQIPSLVYCGNGIVLAGSGSGTGDGDVYRSTDFGQTWTQIEMGSTLERITSLVYCGNGIVLAGSGQGTGDGDVYRSTDFGLNWTQIEMGAGLGVIDSLVYCGNGIVLAGGGFGADDGDVYKSTDFGLNWTQIEMGAGLERIKSLVYCGNGIVLAGSGSGTGDGDIYRSDVGFSQASTIQGIYHEHLTGNIGIGTTDPDYKLEVNGSFAATTKSFIIPHPTKEGYKLRHGSLEGPENGVYVRGRSNSKVIELPEYWVALVDPDSITVSLTPVGPSGVPRVERIENNKVYVFTEDSRPLEYFYMVNAERVDVEPLEVEIPPTN